MSDYRKPVLEAFKQTREITKSNLNSGDLKWEVYDSPLFFGPRAYGDFFHGVMPESKEGKAQDLVELVNYMREKKGRGLVGVDLGGPGSRLFSDLQLQAEALGLENFFAKSYGVVLDDVRFVKTRETDEKLNHKVLIADIFSRKGLKFTVCRQERKVPGLDYVKQTLGQEKADVVFCKMHGGINNKPFNLKFLYLVLNEHYSLLGNDGVLFEHSPYLPTKGEKKEVLNLFYAWIRLLPENIKVKYLSTTYGQLVVSVQKLAGAPEVLPAL